MDQELLLTLGEAGIALAPTFVAFTPWTTLGGYLARGNDVRQHRLDRNQPF